MNKVWLAVCSLIVVALTVADQIIKYFIYKNPDYSRDFVIGQISYWANRGLAFGLPLGKNFIIAATLPIIFYLIYLLGRHYRARHFWSVAALGLVVAGALSNLIDRLRFGFVVDYITLQPWYPTFNIADVMIVGGVILLIIFSRQSSLEKI